MPFVLSDGEPGSGGGANRKVAVPSDSISTTKTGSDWAFSKRSCSGVQVVVVPSKVPLRVISGTASPGSKLVSSEAERLRSGPPAKLFTAMSRELNWLAMLARERPAYRSRVTGSVTPTPRDGG